MRSWTLRVVAGLVLTTMIGLPLGEPVGAQECAAVVDETGQLDVAAVEEAIGDVDGADARVYFFESVPGGDIVVAAENVIAACYSDGPAGRQIDLVLIAVSLGDRETTIQYGAEHNVELGGSAQFFVDEVINPRLAEGDVTRAMQAGLAAVADELDEDSQPPTGPDAEVFSDPAEPGPGSWLGFVLLGLVALAALGILIGRRRQLIDDRNALEAASQQPIVDAGLARERAGMLRSRAEVWEQVVTGKTAARLDDLRDDALRRVADLDTGMANYSRATINGVEALSRDELVIARTRLGELSSVTNAAQSAMDRFQEFGDRLERLRVTMPVKREAIRADVVESLRLADHRQSEGWKIDDQRAVLQRVDNDIATLDLDDLAIDTLVADAAIEAAEASLFEARHDLQTLPDRKAGLIEWAEELATTLDADIRRLGLTGDELVVLSAHHAPESIARAGSVDDVRTKLDASGRDRVLGERQIEEQAWEAAAGNLESAGLWLMRADDLLDHMDALIVSMETARREAPALLDEIVSSIRELDAFVRRHDPDLPESYDVQPQRAAAAHDGLAAELERPRPNHLRVAEAGSTLARQIDQILMAAREEQARVAALRREIARERDRAARELQRADKALGWQMFETDDGRELEGLERTLRDGGGTLEDQLAVAVDVRNRAARVRARIIARRRRRSGWAVGGISTGGSWSSGGGGFSGGGFGGGGFSGGGGSFGGGGASGSW